MDFHLPELGEGVYEAELVGWLVKAGEPVKRGQALMEVMTDKATMEVPSPFAGTIAMLLAKTGQQIKVGQVVLSYTGTESSTSAPPIRQAAAVGQVAPGSMDNGGQRDVPTCTTKSPEKYLAKAAPSVRYMARKLGIDLETIHGTGPQGRILIDDLTSYVQRVNGPSKSSSTSAPRPDYGVPGTRTQVAGLRRKIAEHMVLAKQTIPHYGYVDECDVTDLVRLREQLREPCGRAGIKLTYLAFVVKAVALALREVPIVNASLDEQAGEIVFHDRYDIGLAVATAGGLIVPVIRGADRKSLTQVAADIERLSAAARSGKSRLEDLRNSTFTVTSIGGIGGLFSTPIINHPEVGILGIGKVVRRPVFGEAGNIRPADMVYLSFSFDHRVVDGAVGAAFGNAVLQHLQNPAALLIEESGVGSQESGRNCQA